MSNKVYFLLGSIFLVFLYFCHGDNYLILWKGIPSVLFFSFSCLLVAPVLFYKKTIHSLFKNELLMYFSVFILITLVWSVLSFIPLIGFTTNVKYIKAQFLNFLIMFVCMVFFTREENINITLKLMVYGVLLGVLLNIYDIFHIGNYYRASDDPKSRDAFSMIFARAAGFYLDPNVSSTALVMGLILTEHTVEKYKKKLAYALFVGLGVAITLSLSGVLFYGVYFFLRFIYGKIKLKTIFIFLIIFIGTSYVIQDLIKKEIIHFGPGITKRILAITNPFAAEKDIVEKNSRTILFVNAVEMIIEDPFLGKGIGQHQFVETELSETSRSGSHAGPHNQWLAFIIDFGLLGILLFAILFFVLLPSKKSIYKKEVNNFIIIYFLYSLFSHTAIKNHSLMFLLPLVYQMGQIKEIMMKNE